MANSGSNANCVSFSANTGKGKSVLAIQIGESIARGRSVAPLRVTAKPQPVVYLDLEMTEKQFEMRYAADHQGGRARFLHHHYIFSDNFHRVEIDPAEVSIESGEAAARFMRRSIERLVATTGARVFIIDNLTCLKRSFYGSGEVVLILRMLKRLKKDLDLSILVVAHAPRRDNSRPLSLTDLHGTKVLGNFADNIFAIGQSRQDPGGRYIKHIRTRSSTMLCDASHVPAFELKKIGGNFLGFEYRYFAPEVELLNDIRDAREWALIHRIKQLNDDGQSVRAIAAELLMPKTTVHRLLKMWRAPAETDASESTEDVEAYVADDLYAVPVDHGDSSHDGNKVRWEFPKEAYRGEFTDNYRVRIGLRPVWKEKLLKAEKMRTSGETDLRDKAGETNDDAERYGVAELNGQNGFADESETRLRETPDETDPDKPNGLPPGLHHSIDAYGREIFIEHQDNSGKPLVWYQFDSKQKLQKKELKGHTVVIETPEPP